MVRDECESCGPDDLGMPMPLFWMRSLIGIQDMSTGLFEQIGDLSTGVLSIAWEYMPSGWSPDS